MKYGIIGLSHRLAYLAIQFHAADPEAEIVAVVDPPSARIQEIAKAGLKPVRYDDAAEMLAKHKLDVLMIGSPNAMHLDHLTQVLESDVRHIFAEKPVVSTAAETMDLARVIAKHDGRKRLMIGLGLRYSPLYCAVCKAHADGLLGEIMSIEAAEHIAPYHGSFFMRDWRRESGMSGRFMLEKCCHDLDLYQGLVGARPKRVVSFGGRKIYLPSRRPATVPGYLKTVSPRWGGVNDAYGGAGDIIDYQTALVEYDGGATMAFHTNLNVPDEYRRFMVVGVDGVAEGDFLRNYLRVTISDTGERVVDIQPSSGDVNGHYGADEEMSRGITDHIAGRLEALPLDVVDALEAGVPAMAMDES